MAKLTAASFYEKVTEILSDYEENILTYPNAKIKLERIIAQAKNEELNVNMAVDVLEVIKQARKTSDDDSSEPEDEDSSMIC